MNRDRVNIDRDLDPIPMLHRSKHRDRVKIKVDIENSRQTYLGISLAIICLPRYIE